MRIFKGGDPSRPQPSAWPLPEDARKIPMVVRVPYVGRFEDALGVSTVRREALCVIESG